MKNKEISLRPFFAIAALSLLIELPAVHAAAQAARPCEVNGIHHILRPLYPDRPEGGGLFDYVYLQYRNAEPGFPTIFFLTGGPGYTTIFDQGQLGSITQWYGYPSEAGLVLIEPRGIGCNAPKTGAPYPIDFFSSAYLASDVLAVVNDLHLSKYILHGVSYGTVVATVAAGLAEKGFAPVPFAIVLEGTLGRAFESIDEEFSAPIKQWEKIKTKLPVDIAAAVGASMPLGITDEEWGLWIEQQMLFRSPISKDDDSGIEDPQFYELALLRPGADITKQKEFKQYLHDRAVEVRQVEINSMAMYRAIECREISSNDLNPNEDLDLRLAQGHLFPISSTLCDGVPMDRKFDASKWLTSAPIFYFSGDQDASTPLEQALYSFESEKLSHRTFVELPEAAHDALTFSLGDCNSSIWRSIVRLDSDLGIALKTCRMQSSLTEREPKQAFTKANQSKPF